MSEPVVDAGETIEVRSPDGTVGTVPTKNLDAALAQGFSLLQTSELTSREAAKGADGVLGTATAASLGALRTVSGGLSDKAMIAGTGALAGADEADMTRAAMNAIGDAHPVARVGGELAGFLIPNPISVAGKAVGGIAGKVLPAATGVVGRAARAAGIAGIQGMTEGALVGASGVISEDALGDHETTAEKLWAGASKGALLGGGIGGMLGAGGSLIGDAAGYAGKRLAPKAAAPVEEELTNAAHEETVADWERRLKDATKPTPPAEDSLTERFIRRQADPEKQETLRAFAEARKTLTTSDEILEQTTKRATSAGDELLGSMQATREAFNGEAKSLKMAKLVDAPDPAKSMATLLGTVDGIRSHLAQLADTVGKGADAIGLRNAQEALDAFDARMTKTIDMGATSVDELRAGFVLADRLKQGIGRAAGFGREARNDLHRAMGDLYETMRLHLEDTSLYGKAGEAQATMNKGTTDMLARAQNARKAFVDATESDAGDLVLRADPKRLKLYLGNMGSVTNDLDRESIERFVAGHEAQLDSAGAHWPLDAQEAAQVEKGKIAIAKFRAEMAHAEKQATLANNAKKMAAEEAMHQSRGWFGIVADTESAPMRTVTRLADMQRTLHHIDEKLSTGVDAFLKGNAGPPAAGMANGDAAKIADEARTLSTNTPKMLERVGKAFDGLSVAAPKVATVLSAKAIGSLTWLAARAPRDPGPISTLTPQLHRPSYSDAQMASFARAHRAFEDPLSVLDDMKNGAVTREGVDYLRDNCPKLYGQIQQKMLEQLATAKEPLPYEKRMQIGMLFGIDADPTLNAAFIATMQATKTAAQPAAPGAPAAAQTSGRLGHPTDHNGTMTETERIAAQ